MPSCDLALVKKYVVSSVRVSTGRVHREDIANTRQLLLQPETSHRTLGVTCGAEAVDHKGDRDRVDSPVF